MVRSRIVAMTGLVACLIAAPVPVLTEQPVDPRSARSV